MPLEHAILAFLDLEPHSGYDLKKNFDTSVAHFWSATQSHIYKALDGLEQKGFATVQVVAQEGKPNRREYTITPEGRAELRAWLSTPLPLTPVREAWMIQLFFAHPLSNEQIRDLLQARMDELTRALGALEVAGAAIQQQRQFGPPGIERLVALWQLTLDFGIARYRAEYDWLEKAREQVMQLPLLGWSG